MPRSTRRATRPITVKGTTFLSKVVVPLLKSLIPAPTWEPEDYKGSIPIKITQGTDGTPRAVAAWNTTQILSVAFQRRDEQRATLSFDLHAGLFLTNVSNAALQLGPLLTSKPFHIRFGPELVCGANIRIESELQIHPGDSDLVTERTKQLVQLAYDLDWLTSLYFPERLGFGQRAYLRAAFGDDCFEDEDLPDRLEEGIRNPDKSADSDALLVLAQGLGQWKDVLRIIARRKSSSGKQDFLSTTLGSRAYQEIGQWDRVLTMARQGGIKDGRFEGAPWLSPCYLRALIETGDDIEALRLLGKPDFGEPSFYKLMRGRALHAAGDARGARASFDSYLLNWPGDLEARSVISQLTRKKR